jgi:hypothetical protein
MAALLRVGAKVEHMRARHERGIAAVLNAQIQFSHRHVETAKERVAVEPPILISKI